MAPVQSRRVGFLCKKNRVRGRMRDVGGGTPPGMRSWDMDI